MIGVADNPDLAELYGINKRQVFLVTMLIAGVFVGLGMFLYGTRAQVLPQTGVTLMLFAVAATIIGGIGNVAGAAIAAVILGIIQNASILVIPSEWQGFLLYVFLFLAIVFFPNGLRLPKRRSKFASATRELPPDPHSACRKPGVAAMEYLYGVIIIVGLYVILATSFNLIIGYGGLVSIAHPVFFALGAYTSAMLSRDFRRAGAAGDARGHSGAQSLRRSRSRCRRLRVSGDYLLIASIGFQLGLLEVIKNVRFTGGPGGFTNIPPFLIREFGRESYVLLVLAVMLAAILLVWWIGRSDYGRAMSAMRDDELAFASLGRDAMWMKITIFASRFAVSPASPAGSTRTTSASSRPSSSRSCNRPRS